MRVLYFFPILFFVSPLFSQKTDSLAVAGTLDSLIQVSRDLQNLGKFDEALQVLDSAFDKTRLVFGRAHRLYAACLVAQGGIHYSRGRYAEAEQSLAEAREIQEKLLGADHPSNISLWVRLANVYQIRGQFAEAEKLLLQVRAIREQVSGKENADYAKSLFYLARLYTKMNRFAEADSLLQEVKSLQKKVLDPEHPDYANTLALQVDLYIDLGQFDAAETYCLEAIGIRKKIKGKEQEYALSLNDLGWIYYSKGLYEKAEPVYLESKDLLEKFVGKTHPNYAVALNDLAVVYEHMGRLGKAETLYKEAIDIHLRANGKGSAGYVNSRTNLGNVYNRLGRYEEAESLYLECISTQENLYGKENLSYVRFLNILANLYKEMGRFNEAESLYLQAIDILERLLGKGHHWSASLIEGLGNIYGEVGKMEQSEAMRIKAIELWKNGVGTDHPNYAASTANLAILYSAKGQYAKAEALYLEAQSIFEKIFDPGHPRQALCCLWLANLYNNMDQFEKADSFYQKSRSIFETAVGKNHPDYMFSIYNMAGFFYKTGQYEKSAALFEEIRLIEQSLLIRAAQYLTEQELAAYVRNIHRILTSTYALAEKAEGQETGIEAVCFDKVLFYKGFLRTAVSQLRQLAIADPASLPVFEELASCRRRLAAEYTLPIAERGDIAVLEQKADLLEKTLLQSVPGFARALRQVSWQEVQKSLKPGEAAIEFVHFQPHSRSSDDNSHYAALLLRPGWDAPEFIPLFEQTSLAALLNAHTTRRADYVSNLYSRPDHNQLIAGQFPKSLYTLLWQPLEKYLAGANTIYYSSSGLLHYLNLSAIPINADSVLADRFRLVELGSTRSRVHEAIPSEIKPAANNALLLGGVRYDADMSALQQANPAFDSIAISNRGLTRSLGNELSFTYTDSTLRSGSWPHLPGTEKEIAGIEAILKKGGVRTESRSGFAATEEAFKSIGAGGAETSGSPRILHLATHGFFFPDPKTTLDGRRWTVDGSDPVFKVSDHPMIRSGLLLAGANHAWATGKPLKPGLEDGILTAYEISQMNLSNTELVVLSACETGLGDIQGNEGVYGLQRAFKIAGAKYLIMSLWQVPDRQTSLLMTTFYRKWLEEQMEIPEAFRAAQKELRGAGLDPYQWAGFVLVE